MVYVCNKIVTNNNIVYSVGSVIITKNHYEVTNFSLIENIFIDNEEIYLLLHNLKTVGYIKHFHVYNGQVTHEHEILNIEMTFNKFQLGKCKQSHGMLISLRDLPLE